MRFASRGQVGICRKTNAAHLRGGEPDKLFYRLPEPRVRKLLLLLDITGSKAPFAREQLRFGYAVFRYAAGRTEVFISGIPYTRIAASSPTATRRRCLSTLPAL